MAPETTLSSIREFFYSDRLFRAFRRTGRCLDFPRGLQIQTQSRCNGGCRICPYPQTAALQPHGVMSESLFLKIAREAAQEPLFSSLVFMLQNEPLLDKRLFSWIRRFKTMNNRKKTVLISNGERLDDFSLSEIAASGLDELVISLNALTEQTFNKLHPGLNYARIRNNIDRLLANKGLRPIVAISFIQTRQNLPELSQAVRYWRRRGVPLQVGGLVNRAGALQDYAAYAPDNRGRPPAWRLRRKWHRWYLRSVLNLDVCQTPLVAMYILYNGDVILCCNDWQRHLVIGNVERASVRRLWNSPAMQQWRTLLWQGDYAATPPCKACSVAAAIKERHER